MEGSNKSMKEKLESLATNAPNLDQLKSVPMEDKRMTENNGIGPETAGTNRDIVQGPGHVNVSEDPKGMETKPEGVLVDFERIMRDFPSHQDIEGKFKLLNEGKCHLEIMDDSIQLFENGELLGVMFPGDKLDLDFGTQTAKVINYPMKEDSKALTFGQKAVGTTLKITEDVKITQARSLMAAAVDLLEEVHQERTSNGAASSTWARNVFRTEAFNQLVNASGSLVKYISWQD